MYSFDMRVGFSQSDLKHNMVIPAIIDAYQDCSCYHSEDLGVGFYYLEPQNLVWIINYWEVEFIRMPKYPDKITVGTFPYDFKGFLGFRNFFLKDEQGEYLSKANSLWVLMDWKNMVPAKVPNEVKEAYKLEPKLDMEYSSRKIKVPLVDEAIVYEASPIKIVELNLDSNGHVNNGQYIKIAMSCIPQGREYKRLRVEYRNQAHLGDEIYPKVYETEEKYVISLDNDKSLPYAVIELQF